MLIRSDSQSAIARASHTGPGPVQRVARSIERKVRKLPNDRSVQIEWVKGHSGIPGNEKADRLAGTPADKPSSGPTSLAYLKLAISNRFAKAKEKWYHSSRFGSDFIRPPPPKKSCLDDARNSLARTASQIRTGHWRSAAYLHRIKRHPNNHCWFCFSHSKMTRSHVLLHCPNPRLEAARHEAWGTYENPQRGTSTILKSPLGETSCFLRPLWCRQSGRGRIEPGQKCWTGRSSGKEEAKGLGNLVLFSLPLSLL